ncbi:hypothetical protein KGM_212455 [Danaus plexippus plexippus]|uniref:Uncharacterized protein n=1 Tax=Danaus plexippus plexippus TaxID=278856 RepID=A0A212F2B4_DANPL|nr:hypothetical protein KGM_212455 [Danaus plexippus plexippus]
MAQEKRRHIRELLEKRIKQLEDQLEEEKRRTQRERMAVTKLQNKLIKNSDPCLDGECERLDSECLEFSMSCHHNMAVR